MSCLNHNVGEEAMKNVSSVVCDQFDLRPELLGKFSEQREQQGEFTSVSGFTAFCAGFILSEWQSFY